jgi:hypothetical protein
MKTKLVLLLSALTVLLIILSACSPKPETLADGARANQDGTIYISHVEPANLTLTKQPTNFIIAFVEPMDQDSVEEALQVCDGVEYSYRWSNKDFLISIMRGAEKLGSCTISLASPVESREGEVFPGTSWELVVQFSTATPTRTPLPTYTARPPSAQGLTPTALSFSPITPLFPTATYPHNLGVTTTPIPTPVSSTVGFRLAQFSIEEYVDLIRELDQYAFANDVIGAGDHRYHYPHYQYPMKFAVLEALRKHPKTTFTEELEWKLALINATAELPESDEWIINTLENALNQGILLPSEINIYLNQFGFKVDQSTSEQLSDVPNLFGDGNPQSILVINTDSQHNYSLGAEDGILATLRGSQPGEYDLVKIFSRYGFDAGSWYPACGDSDAIDIDQDGINEVCATFTLGYAGILPTNLYLLEWQGNQFINLAENVPYIGNNNKFYVFYPEKHPGVDIMIERYVFFDYLHGYAFNGDNFEMVFSDPAIDLVNDHVYKGNFSLAVSEIERLLSMDTVDEILESEPLSTGLQKLEFAAGLVYALNNQSAEAKLILKNLIASINSQEYPQMLQAVQAFDQVYYDAADLYLACHAALEILEPVYEEVHEYSWEYQDPVMAYCRSSAPILAAINLIDPTAATDLPTALSDSGIELINSAAVDALNDGNRDWVISAQLLEKGDFSPDQSTILAIQQNGQWVAQEVNSTHLPSQNLTAGLAYLPGLTYPAVVLLDGGKITIVEVNVIEEEVNFKILLNQSATSYSFVTLDSVFIKALNFVDACDSDYYNFWVENFGWNEQTSSFEKGDPIANLLFSQNVSPSTISTLQHLYQDVSVHYQLIERLPEDCYGGTYIDYRAKLLYAIGLAYELNGDTANAIQTYYRVWAEHPGTPYAIIARAKLEPLSP